jgi:hypothetical protein
MKKLNNLTMIAIACLAVACHKNAELTTLGTVKFTGPLTASTTSAYITPADTASSLVTLKWPAVVYPYKEQVTYTLLVDIPSDTLGSTPWANATTLLIGNDILTTTLKGSLLNSLAIKAGLTANDTGKLVMRVQAYQDRNVFSNAVAITVSPYAPPATWPVLYLPGDYQGWSPSTAGTAAAPPITIYPLANSANIYEGYLYETAGGTYQFKFTSAPDWNHINYGDSGTPGVLTTNGAAAGMTLPGPGEYEVSANPVALTWSYTLITWAVIGDATPNGWGTETEMTLNPANNSWSITLPMVTSGSFKFRANNAWNIDFGLDPNGKIYYADNPVFGGGGCRPNLSNLTVPANGTYTLTLYLGDPNNYHYTAVKN